MFVYCVEKQHYSHIYQEQLFNNQLLKVNIIQWMIVGPPTVSRTTLKEQLLVNYKMNTTTNTYVLASFRHNTVEGKLR